MYIRASIINIFDEPFGVRLDFARRPDISSRILEELAEDSDPIVRHAVSINPHTPEASLRMLAQDHYPHVRDCALYNLKTLGKDISEFADRIDELNGEVVLYFEIDYSTVDSFNRDGLIDLLQVCVDSEHCDLISYNVPDLSLDTEIWDRVKMISIVVSPLFDTKAIESFQDTIATCIEQKFGVTVVDGPYRQLLR